MKKVSPDTMVWVASPLSTQSLSSEGSARHEVLSGLQGYVGTLRTWSRVMKPGLARLLSLAMSQMPEESFCEMMVRVSPDDTV